MTANSSPPTRHTVSDPRTVERRTSATCSSTWSPSRCPQTSFTRLKSSMSSIISATVSWARPARWSSERRCSWKYRWL